MMHCFYIAFVLSVVGAVFGGSTNPSKSDKCKLGGYFSHIFFSVKNQNKKG